MTHDVVKGASYQRELFIYSAACVFIFRFSFLSEVRLWTWIPYKTTFATFDDCPEDEFKWKLEIDRQHGRLFRDKQFRLLILPFYLVVPST